MKVIYDREEDVLMIEVIPEGTIDHAEHSGPVIAHFTADGVLVLLEILDASHFMASLLLGAMQGEAEVAI